MVVEPDVRWQIDRSSISGKSFALVSNLETTISSDFVLVSQTRGRDFHSYRSYGLHSFKETLRGCVRGNSSVLATPNEIALQGFSVAVG